MVTAVASRVQAQRKQIDKVLNLFQLTREQLLGVRDKMRVELEYGLKKKTHALATVKMLPTYVYGMPDGTGGLVDWHLLSRGVQGSCLHSANAMMLEPWMMRGPVGRVCMTLG